MARSISIMPKPWMTPKAGDDEQGPGTLQEAAPPLTDQPAAGGPDELLSQLASPDVQQGPKPGELAGQARTPLAPAPAAEKAPEAAAPAAGPYVPPTQEELLASTKGFGDELNRRYQKHFTSLNLTQGASIEQEMAARKFALEAAKDELNPSLASAVSRSALGGATVNERARHDAATETQRGREIDIKSKSQATQDELRAAQANLAAGRLAMLPYETAAKMDRGTAALFKAHIYGQVMPIAAEAQRTTGDATMMTALENIARNAGDGTIDTGELKHFSDAFPAVGQKLYNFFTGQQQTSPARALSGGITNQLTGIANRDLRTGGALPQNVPASPAGVPAGAPAPGGGAPLPGVQDPAAASPEGLGATMRAALASRARAPRNAPPVNAPPRDRPLPGVNLPPPGADATQIGPPAAGQPPPMPEPVGKPLSPALGSSAMPPSGGAAVVPPGPTTNMQPVKPVTTSLNTPANEGPMIARYRKMKPDVDEGEARLAVQEAVATLGKNKMRGTPEWQVAFYIVNGKRPPAQAAGAP